MKSRFLQICAVFMMAINTTEACSLFWLRSQDSTFIGHNYDWYQAGATFVVNKRQVQKTGLLSAIDFSSRKQWVSSYASLTVNQHGIGHPIFGINENKLYVGLAWLNDSTYINNGKPAINEAQLVQYLLDQAQNLEEAIALLDTVRVRSLLGLVHYLVCEPTECAIVEYFNNEMTVERHPAEDIVGITNDSLIEMNKAKRKKSFLHPQETTFMDSDSLARYQVGYALGNKILAEKTPLNQQKVGMLLEALANGYRFLSPEKKEGEPEPYTNLWQGIVSFENPTINLKTAPDFRLGISISLSDFDLDCTENKTYEVADTKDAITRGKGAFKSQTDATIDSIFFSAYDLPFAKGPMASMGIGYLRVISKSYPKEFICKK